MISHHVPNASFLDGSVTVQELCTRLLDTSTTFAELLTGYNLSVLCSSSFGHSQVGHSMVLLSAVAAISNPSMLMMCQKAHPRRTNLSAQR